MDNRRQQYRVDLSIVGFLEASMHLPSHQSLSAKLLDLSGEGAGAVFPIVPTTDIEIGMEVDFEMMLPGLPEPFFTKSIIRSVQATERYLRCGLEFIDPDRARLGPELQRLFNRRIEARLQLGFDSPAPVTLDCQEGMRTVRGSLFDISASGICIQVDELDAHHVCVFERIPISFRLPGQNEDLVFEGVVRNRRIVDGKALYGVEFDLHPSMRADDRLLLIRNFVSEHVIAA